MHALAVDGIADTDCTAFLSLPGLSWGLSIDTGYVAAIESRGPTMHRIDMSIHAAVRILVLPLDMVAVLTVVRPRICVV